LFDVAVGTGISQLQFANMNLTRNIFVVGFSLFMGLSVPQYFNEFATRAGHGPVNTDARWVRINPTSDIPDAFYDFNGYLLSLKCNITEFSELWMQSLHCSGIGFFMCGGSVEV
jgi:hypothetical protein